MPLYFMHVTEGDQVFPDPEGIERETFAAVQRAAIEGVSELIAEAVKRGDYDYRGRLEVEDARGENVLTVAFACPVTIEVTRPSAEGDQAANDA